MTPPVGSVWTQQVTELLEKLILPTIQDQVFRKNILLQYFRKPNPWIRFKNNQIFITNVVSWHSGVWFTWKNWGIPIGNPTYQQMSVTARYAYGSHMIMDRTISEVKWDPWSLANIMKLFWDELRKEMSKVLNRNLYSDETWKLATISANGSSTKTHAVDSTRNLRIGQKLLIGTKAQIEGNSWFDTATVDKITSDTSVVFKETITTAQNDIIVTEWAYDVENSEWTYMSWMRNLISNNTIDAWSNFQGISRANNSWANSLVDTTSEKISEAKMIKAITECNEYWDVNLIMCHPNLKNAYASLLQSQRRFATAKLEGWYVWIEVAAGDRPIALVWDYDCPKDEMYFLDTSTWALAILDDIQYLYNGSGWILHPARDTNWKLIAAYQVTMKVYLNLVCTNPRANARFTNKSVS